MVPAARRYLPGTMVLETSWGTPTGWIIVRDVLLMGPWHHDDERSRTHRRAPTDYDADHVLLRTVRCVNGEVQVVARLRADASTTAARRAQWTLRRRRLPRGRRHAPRAWTSSCGSPPTCASASRAAGRWPATLLKEGETRFCALSWSEHEPPTHLRRGLRAGSSGRRTTGSTGSPAGTSPTTAGGATSQRSALTLKGLTFAPTGALVAAATTSLPETPGGERNWDYRYSWIRDSTFALWALYTLGFDWEANDFFWFIADVAERDEDLQVMYGIDGERDLDEEIARPLSGYEGARPVRIGNGAYNQRQHDVWGAVLDSVLPPHEDRATGSTSGCGRSCARQVEAALAHWREPDRGIWEVRGEPKHFTSSKLMCWVAADRGARLARLREDTSWPSDWQAAADEIHADICANGVDERGVFTQHYDTDALDASLLLMPLVRFLPADDPRVAGDRAGHRRRADRRRARAALPRRGDRRRAGRRGGRVPICSFWLVSALVEIGEHGRARELCEKLLSSPARSASTPRRSTRAAAPPRQLPAGVHPPGPDQRRDARHPVRAGQHDIVLHTPAGLSRDDGRADDPAAALRRRRTTATTSGAVLIGYLDYHRAVLARKAEGITEEQARFAACPPSGLTLLGLIRHLADAERQWFRRSLMAEDVLLIYGDWETGLHPPPEATLAEALAVYWAEIETANANVAAASLDQVGAGEPGHGHSLRRTIVHMIEEYARHCGHADLLREAIDGATGD